MDIYQRVGVWLICVCYPDLTEVELRPSHRELTLSVYIAKRQLLGPGESKPWRVKDLHRGTERISNCKFSTVITPRVVKEPTAYHQVLVEINSQV